MNKDRTSLVIETCLKQEAQKISHERMTKDISCTTEKNTDKATLMPHKLHYKNVKIEHHYRLKKVSIHW